MIYGQRNNPSPSLSEKNKDLNSMLEIFVFDKEFDLPEAGEKACMHCSYFDSIYMRELELEC